MLSISRDLHAHVQYPSRPLCIASRSCGNLVQRLYRHLGIELLIATGLSKRTASGLEVSAAFVDWRLGTLSGPVKCAMACSSTDFPGFGFVGKTGGF
jgi:hypothetical protein